MGHFPLQAYEQTEHQRNAQDLELRRWLHRSKYLYYFCLLVPNTRMKTIIIFRHAKSDWSSAEANDQDRPLASRGRKSAKLMGRFLEKTLVDNALIDEMDAEKLGPLAVAPRECSDGARVDTPAEEGPDRNVRHQLLADNELQKGP